MDAATFKNAVLGNVVLPKVVLEIIAGQSGELSPANQEKIVAELRASEEREMAILERGTADVARLQRRVGGAVRKGEENVEQARGQDTFQQKFDAIS